LSFVKSELHPAPSADNKALLRLFDEETLHPMLGLRAIKLLDAWDATFCRPSALRAALAKTYVYDSRVQMKECRNAVNAARRTSPRAFTSTGKLWFEASEYPSASESELPGTHSIEQLNPDYGLHPYQRQVQKDALRHLFGQSQRCLVHMPTGAGKTRTAMSICSQLMRESEGKSVIWIANSDELCQQAADEFSRAWKSLGNRPVHIVQNYGQHNGGWECANAFNVASIQKLVALNKRKPTVIAGWPSKYALIAFDEAHISVAPGYSQIIQTLVAFPQTRLLGLSATPGRIETDAQRELCDLFAGNLVGIAHEGYKSSIDLLIDKRFLAKPVFSKLPYKGDALTDSDRVRIANSADIPSDLLEQLACDDLRNIAVLNSIRNLTEQHKRIMVFAPSVENAQLLALLLNCTGIESYCVDANTPRNTRKRYLDLYRTNDDVVRVLTNFSVLAAGFDAPQTSAVVISRPTKSLILYSQMIGRALRGPAAGGSSTAKIIAIRDEGLASSIDMDQIYNFWRKSWDS